MEFVGHHGCFEEERIIGTKFSVDVSFFYDADAAAQSDDLSLAVNYQEVHQAVDEEMRVSSNLIENVAYRILRRLKERFPQLSQTEVTVSKLNPVLGGKTASASVTLSE